MMAAFLNETALFMGPTNKTKVIMKVKNQKNTLK